jgi:class 3 adenylate cyclase
MRSPRTSPGFRARLTGVREVEVRYADRNGKCLAFELFGSGPCDVLVHQVCCPIDLMWELPQLASFMDTLGGFARMIAFDSRGEGASDPIADPGAATLEMWCDDALAVLDAAGAERVTFFDMTLGVGGVMFAATYPERVRSLILTHLRTSFPENRDLSAEQRTKAARAFLGMERLEAQNPRVAHDPVVRRWWGRAHRLLLSPEAALGYIEWSARMDVEPVLSSVRAPTLVMHRQDNRVYDLEMSRAAARQIPHARFVEIPGSDADVFLGDTRPVLAEIEQFLAEPEVEVGRDRVLATVLFTDIVSSTEQLVARGDGPWRHLLDDHDKTTNRVVAEYRGRVVKQLGDGILATFDGPARAVLCAAVILDAAKTQGITLRAGLHTGEIERRPSDVAGIAVHIASRIAALADPNEILVSRTVVDLTAGSGLRFEPRGEHELKGVPGSWLTFAAYPTAASTC